MRDSVAERGIAGSTFDQVARAAGVSRGLLHYYFGSKERLLVEAVRRESVLRHGLLDQAVAGASSADEVLAALVSSFEDFLQSGPGNPVMFYEMLTLAQRNQEIASALGELMRRSREHLAEVLRAKTRDGVLELRTDADVAAALLFALADGITVRRVAEPDFDIGPLMAQAVEAARVLLG